VNRRTVAFMTGLLALMSADMSARAADVLADWAGVTPPPAPSVLSVRADVRTTALLLLDFNTPPCDPAANPRCIAAIPAVRSLLERARAKGMLVIYTLGASNSPESINPALRPLRNDPVIPARPDKFLNSDLDRILREHGIRTVITAGTTANGAVLYTASEAAFRGYDVLVPVDAVPGLTPYAEQMTLWQLMNGPRLGGEQVRLTRAAAIAF
jgi:nicotinamidase-related amidase